MKVSIKARNLTDAPLRFGVRVFQVEEVETPILGSLTGETKKVQKLHPMQPAAIQAPLLALETGPGAFALIEFEWPWPSYDPKDARFKAMPRQSMKWELHEFIVADRNILAAPGRLQ